MRHLPDCLLCAPTVFVLDGVYQIFVALKKEAVVRIKVGGETYYDDSNGILRSTSPLHRVEIPCEELDAAGEYTVSCRVMLERTPYFPTSEEPVEVTIPFRPVRGEKIEIYHIADVHNMAKEPVKSYRLWGKQADLLVLNGDIPNHSGTVENFYTIYEIASEITEGEFPVVFSRGNHDTRGLCAEKFAEYTPSMDGRTYYTFRAGSLWGMVLDCGEDKPDTHEAYGDTVCFHSFRKKETAFLKNVIAHAGTEYAAEDVKYRMVICHIPFTKIHRPPFDIEQELYGEWSHLVGEQIRPDVLLFGHEHRTEIWHKESEQDSFHCQSCAAVIGAKPLFSEENAAENRYIGCGLSISPDGVDVAFSHSEDGVFGEEHLPLTTR